MKTCLPQNKRSRKTPKINDCDLLTASFLRFHNFQFYVLLKVYFLPCPCCLILIQLTPNNKNNIKYQCYLLFVEVFDDWGGYLPCLIEREI